MSDDSFVTCRLYGQLGNQLYQLATTLAYAWDYGAYPLFPELHNSAYRISYNKERLFFRLDASSSPRPWRHLFQESCWYSHERVPFRPDQILDGYFQSWHHFDHHRSRLLQVFAPSESTLGYLHKKYAQLFSAQHTVGIHVRTQTAYAHASGHHPFLGMDYFRTAISLFPDDAIFVICSDRINWCKKHFPSLERNFVFIDGNDGIEDLILLTLMQDMIMTNSSFSWWGAYLNQNPSKKIVAPPFFKNPSMHQSPPPELFFPPNWVTIPVVLKDPYPKDMFEYDVVNKSLDGARS